MADQGIDAQKSGAAATRNRVVRVRDELWQAALDKADERGDNLSQKIREFLVDYSGADPELAQPVGRADGRTTRGGRQRGV